MKNICIFVVFVVALVAGVSAQVAISSPASGATVSSPVQFVASATSSNRTYPITAMRIYVDDQSTYTAYAGSINTSLPLTGGPHNVAVVAWDASGRAYTKSVGITVGTPAASSGVTITSPANGATVSAPVRFTASASSSNSAYPITAMRIYVDDSSAYLVNAASLNTSLTLANGAHNVVVVAWDASGHSYTNRIGINVGSGASTPGGVTITAPGSASSYASPVQFAAAATASSGKSITAMRIYVDNASAYTVSAASLNTSLSLSSGTHNVVVQAWDNTGGVYKSTKTINVTGSAALVSHSATLGWNPSASTGVVGYNVYRGTRSGGPYTKITSAPQPGNSYVDLSVSSGATYYYVLTALSGAGQESAYSTQAAATIP